MAEKEIDEWPGYPNFTDEEIQDKMLVLNGPNRNKDRKKIDQLMMDTFRYRRSSDTLTLRSFVRFEDTPYLVNINFYNFFSM